MLKNVCLDTTTLFPMTPSCSFTLNKAEYIHYWKQWADQAIPGQGEYRDIAVQRLVFCLENNTKDVDLSALNLTDLPMHFPPSMVALYANSNQLTELPNALPSTVTKLNLNNNKLTRLSTLPSQLITLKVRANKLKELPQHWPETLKRISLCDNKLEVFPKNLPSNLEQLFLNHNRYTEIPSDLPAALIILKMRFNFIETFPNTLPPNLTLLDVTYNKLSHLRYPLPNRIMALYLGYNRIVELPEVWPMALQQLDISSNPLRRFPENFPPSHLTELLISGNQRTLLPVDFPTSVKVDSIEEIIPSLVLDFVNEFFDTYTVDDPSSSAAENATDRLNAELRDIFSSDSSSSSLEEESSEKKTLVDRIRRWSKAFNATVWKQIEGEENADVFGDFLKILHSGSNKVRPVVRHIIVDWINYLAKEGNTELRKHTFLIAKEVTINCVDRASYYFNNMYLLKIEDEIIKTSPPLETIVPTIIGMYRMGILERIAAEHVKHIKINSATFSDDIEIYFAYHSHLHNVLQLPVPTRLFYQEVGDISETRLNSAVAHVLHKEKQEFLRYLVIESSLWAHLLQKWNKSSYDQANADYLDYLNSALFQQRIDSELRNCMLPAEDADAHRNVIKKCAEDALFERRLHLTQSFLNAHDRATLLNEWMN